ncbi:MAG: IS1182 family transposase [Culicoidibacterales bacterium]
MLMTTSEMKFSEYNKLYDILVPKEHFLRKFKNLVDFGFIYDELKSAYCEFFGRVAEDPIRMFKYLILKDLYNLSDRGLVQRAHTDLAFKYFLDLVPEADVIDATTLCHFRKERIKTPEFLDILIAKSMEIAFRAGVIKSHTVIIDATHTRAAYNAKTPIEILRERSKNLRKKMYAVDKNCKDDLPEKYTGTELAQEVKYTHDLITVLDTKSMTMFPAIAEARELLIESLDGDANQSQSLGDATARIGYKSADDAFFGYKSHIAMTDERIICAVEVTAGNEADGKHFISLLEKTKQNGVEIKTILADAAYSGKAHINYAHHEKMQLVAKLNPIITGENHHDTFTYNKDSGRFVCPAGHEAIRKAKTGKKNVQRNQSETHYFDIEKCKVCPFKSGCYRENAKSKTYSVTIKTPNQVEQITFQNSDEFKLLARDRYKIEAKNAELKNIHGLKNCKSDGLFGMTLQAGTTMFVVNIKRILKLMEE